MPAAKSLKESPPKMFLKMKTNEITHFVHSEVVKLRKLYLELDDGPEKEA